MTSGFHTLISTSIPFRAQAWPTMLDDYVAWKKAKDADDEVNVDDS